MFIIVTGMCRHLDTRITVTVIVLLLNQEAYSLVDVAIMMTLAEVEDEVISTAAAGVEEDEEGGGVSVEEGVPGLVEAH